MRARIFADDKTKSTQGRSARRIRDYWQRKKKLRKMVLSSIVYNGADIRPYASLNIFGKSYLALLDSGANKSCIGANLAKTIIEGHDHKYRRILGSVRTADGKKQNIVGSISISLSFNHQEREFEFLLVPTVANDIICGMDFWQVFGLTVTPEPNINELCSEVDSDTLPLTSQQRGRIESVIAAFPSFEKEGLGSTTLIEHNIDTRTATPIKQRYYPISPAMEKVLCKEIDRMLELGVIEEAEGSPWSSQVY